ADGRAVGVGLLLPPRAQRPRSEKRERHALRRLASRGPKLWSGSWALLGPGRAVTMGVRGSGHTERIRLLGTGRHTGFPRGEPGRYLTPETPLGRGPPVSLDDGVGAYQDRLWNCRARRSSGLHVDHQLEPGRLLDGKIGGLGAVQLDQLGCQRAEPLE